MELATQVPPVGEEPRRGYISRGMIGETPSSSRSSLVSNDAFNPRIAGPPTYSSDGNSVLCGACRERFDESLFRRVGAVCKDKDTFYW